MQLRTGSLSSNLLGLALCWLPPGGPRTFPECTLKGSHTRPLPRRLPRAPTFTWLRRRVQPVKPRMAGRNPSVLSMILMVGFSSPVTNY